MHRLVHEQQLFGGEVEVHWSPEMAQALKLFGLDSMGGLMRLSDASNQKNPDGKSMFGMALELVGNEGQVTDILLTGGNEKTEVSQAKDPESQLALFNMLDHPFAPGGLVQMGWEVGPVTAGKMVYDVSTMKTDLDTLADLTAWSRAPFRLYSSEDTYYLAKMRAVPAEPSNGPVEEPQGETSAERLTSELRARAEQQEVRWRYELQLMQPGEDPDDGREKWNGPWLSAGEIVIPRVRDEARAEEMAQAADQVKFNIWKGKAADDQGSDATVFYPHGKTNQARRWAYGRSARNRGIQG